MKKTLQPIIGSDRPRTPEPIALTAGQLKQVSGGLNPQPLPPGDRLE